MKDVRGFLHALLWLVVLLTAEIGLHELSDTYPLPAHNVPALQEWATNTETTLLVLTIVRVVTMVLVGYVLMTTVACAIAHRSSRQRLASCMDSITLPATRTLAIRLASMSVVTGLTMPVATAAATTNQDVPVLRHLAPGESFPPITPTTTAPSVVTHPPSPPRQHLVARGENFWTIAQDTLSSSLRRDPTEKEVTAYWRMLVDANQRTLRKTNNPDLLFAGQVIELPPTGRDSQG